MTRHPLVLGLAAWVWGMATTVERLQGRFRRMARRLGEGRELADGQLELIATVGSDWGRYGLHVLLLGAFSGALVWVAGTWWYRKRLQLSDAEVPVAEARRIYLLAGLVWALPVLFTAALGPLLAPTPWEALRPTLSEIGAGGHLASFAVSTVCVLGFFPVHRGKAVAWFLVLPSALVGAVVLAARLS